MNAHKILLGAVQIKPSLAPYALPGLEIEQFPADLQPVFAALSGFWEATGTLDTVQVCARYPAQQEAILGCVEACQNECVAITRERVERWAQLIREQYALTCFQSLAMRAQGPQCCGRLVNLVLEECNIYCPVEVLVVLFGRGDYYAR